MASIPLRPFRRALRGLDADAFAAFVADCFERGEWSVERDGDVLVASRSGETRRLQVLPPRRLARVRPAPHVREDVDAVVTARSAAAGADGALAGLLSGRRASLPADDDVVDAAELRERLLYSLSPADRDAVADEHLGVEPVGPRWAGGASPPPRVAAVDAARRAPVAVVALVAVLALLATVGVAGSAGVLPSATSLADVTPGDGGTAASDDGAAAAGEADAGESSSEDGSDEGSMGDEAGEGDDGASVREGRALSDQEHGEGASVYDLEPTCEREPAEIARLLADVFVEHESASTYVYWQFLNPDIKDQISYSAYGDVYAPTFEAVADAQHVSLGEPERIEGVRGEALRVNATAHYADGSTRPFAFQFEHYEGEHLDGCWVVNQFAGR